MSVGISATPGPGRALRAVILASLVGSVVEWYDFSVYTASAALVFDKVFFPNFDPAVAILLSLITYGVGFAARPIGGIIFGHFGDRLGRRPVLVLTFLVMGIATILMGLLPTYSAAGTWAPVLLTALRVVQGIAVGGEFGGAALLATETSPPRRRGLFSSSALVGQAAGTLLGTAVFAAFATLPQDVFMTWGWRAPFILSVILVITGLLVRTRVDETPEFLRATQGGTVLPKAPLLDVVRYHWARMLLIFGARVGETMQYNVVSVFALSYAVRYLHVSRSVFLSAITIASLVQIIASPIGGALSDVAGRRPVYQFAGLLSIVSGAALFPLLGLKSTAFIMLAVLLSLGVAVGLNNAVPSAYFPELFPVRHRYTAISLGYQLGTVAGGFTPAICAALFAGFGIGAIVAYTVAAGVLIFVCVTFLPETAPARSSSQAAHEQVEPAAPTG